MATLSLSCLTSETPAGLERSSASTSHISPPGSPVLIRQHQHQHQHPTAPNNPPLAASRTPPFISKSKNRKCCTTSRSHSFPGAAEKTSASSNLRESGGLERHNAGGMTKGGGWEQRSRGGEGKVRSVSFYRCFPLKQGEPEPESESNLQTYTEGAGMDIPREIGAGSPQWASTRGVGRGRGKGNPAITAWRSFVVVRLARASL